MFLQWTLFGLLLWPLVSTVGDTQSHGAGRKMSTLLSFDLRRKTKHHHERNVTISLTTPAPTTNNAKENEEEEEIEFSLRVGVIRLRTRNLYQLSLFMTRMTVKNSSKKWLSAAITLFFYFSFYFFLSQSTSYAYVIELDLGTPPQRVKYLFIT